MTTTRRMTQQSRRALETATEARVYYLAGAEGYTIQTLHDDRLGYVSSTEGPMVYPTTELAIRAIRRVRPDLSSADIPITWESRPGLRDELPEPDDAERILEDLHAAQHVAQKLFDALTEDPATCDTRHAFYARSLVGRLMSLESDLLATPPAG